MKNKQLIFMTRGAVIAALYVVLTFVSNLLGLANGVIQVRISEALTVLPYFTPSAIPGLFIGCVISNILTGCALWDVIFGSLTTLAAAFLTYMLRRIKWLVPVPPILLNAAVIPVILSYVYGAEDGYFYIAATVFTGELVSCGIVGMTLLFILEKYSRHADIF